MQQMKYIKYGTNFNIVGKAKTGRTIISANFKIKNFENSKFYIVDEGDSQWLYLYGNQSKKNAKPGETDTSVHSTKAIDYYKFMNKIMPERFCALDLGANHGQTALEYFRFCNFEWVYSLEAHPDMYECTKRTLEESRNYEWTGEGEAWNLLSEYSTRIKTLEYAVSDVDGDGFFSDSNIDAENHLVAGDTTGKSGVHVKMRSIDSLYESGEFKHDPTFIKIDVEGAEKLVLEGGRTTITKYKPIMQLEIIPWNLDGFDLKPQDIFDWFDEFNKILPAGEEYLAFTPTGEYWADYSKGEEILQERKKKREEAGKNTDIRGIGIRDFFFIPRDKVVDYLKKKQTKETQEKFGWVEEKPKKVEKTEVKKESDIMAPDMFQGL